MNESYEPAKIEVVPHRGGLAVTPHHIKVQFLANPVHAGESIAAVANWYGVSEAEVRLALKYCPSFKSRDRRRKLKKLRRLRHAK